MLRNAMAIIGAACSVYLVTVWLPRQISISDGLVDMVAYRHGAQAIINHTLLYDAPWRTYGPDRWPVWYLYSPQFAVVFRPAGLLSYHTYAIIWLILTTTAIF